MYGQLQHGQAVTLPDGRMVQPTDVLGPARRGRRFVLSGDTRPCEAIERVAQNADLLIHEATFADDSQARALETRHSTAREAAQLARRAKVRRLLLTHFSSRYEDDVSQLAREAREELPETQLAHDGLTLELPLP